MFLTDLWDFLTKPENTILLLIISFLTLYLQWRANKDNKESNYQLYLDRRNEKYTNNSKPYILLVHNTFYELKEIFSQFSHNANESLTSICAYTDKFDNNAEIKNKDLRHYLSRGIYKIIRKNKNDILYQCPQNLFSTNFNQYSSLIYNLDLVTKKKENLEYYIKTLYDRIDIKDRKEYGKLCLSALKNTYKIYKKNNVFIDLKLSILEKEYSKLEKYEISNISPSVAKDLRDILNLLRYIKYISESSNIYLGEEMEITIISDIFAETLKIMATDYAISSLSR